MGSFVAVVNVYDELMKVAITAGIPALIGGAIAAMRALLKRLRTIAETTSETQHLVKYHLGPNGDSPQLFRRIEALERAHAKEDQE